MDPIKSYGRQSIDSEDIEAVVAALKGELLTTGPTINEFERQINEFCGSRESIVVSNGTAGLHLAMLALGIGAGDAVIVPALTFAATANVVLYVGATPIFADISEKTWGLDVENVSAGFDLAIKKGLRPKAVIAVHYAGLPVELGAIHKFCQEKDLYLIEDACHALGALYRQDETEQFVPVGNSSFSDLTVFSFHPVKPITTGEGGAITTNQVDLARKLRLLRSHGITRDPDEFVNRGRSRDSKGQLNPWYMEMILLGYNYRLPDILAALGISQLKKLEKFIARRKSIVDFYRNGLSETRAIVLPPYDYELAQSGHHLFSLSIDFKAINKTRAEVIEELKAKGIASQVMYLPIHWHPYYNHNRHRYLSLELARTEELYERLLALPLYPTMSNEQAQHVIEQIKRVLG